MFDLDKWQDIFNSLHRHKLRTLLTAFGVFWGIFMLVLLLGVGRGLENGVYAQFSKAATNRLSLWGGQTRLPYKGLNRGRWIRFTTDDIEAIRQHLPEAQYVTASVGLWGQYSINYQDKNGSFPVQGVFPEFLHIRYLEIQGRFLNLPDIIAKRKVAVIGRRVQKVLFGKDEPIGKYITIKGVLFQVVGVFDVTGFGSNERDTERIYIPLPTLQQTFDQGDYVGGLTVVADPDVAVSAIEPNAKDILKRRHTIAPQDDRAIGSWDASAEFHKLQALFRGIKIFMWIVGTGTILAGVVGISNIMLIIVKERTREIGIRKALGATPFAIISLILQESIFLTAISGYLGLVISVGMLEGVSYLMEKFGLQSEFFSHPEIEFPTAMTATVILILAGIFAGFIPARSAARINPIEALRGE
jgi:putative ABC transport system permease protein